MSQNMDGRKTASIFGSEGPPQKETIFSSGVNTTIFSKIKTGDVLTYGKNTAMTKLFRGKRKQRYDDSEQINKSDVEDEGKHDK